LFIFNDDDDDDDDNNNNNNNNNNLTRFPALLRVSVTPVSLPATQEIRMVSDKYTLIHRRNPRGSWTPLLQWLSDNRASDGE